MGVKIFSIILLLFVLEIAFLTTHEPITLDIKSSPLDFSNITFEQIQAYILTKEGTQATLKAQKALAYNDRNELYKVDANLYNSSHIDTIKADKAIQKDEIVHLYSDISYESNNTMLLKSDELLYNTKTKIAKSLAPFSLNHKNMNAKGSSFVFDTLQNILHAKYVTLTLEEEK